ncbi:hypothetical protein KC901_02180 [Patescibacteria group bacterium]|nr:hypothetical protein [Patescibacteria group bacterium]
MKDERLKNLEKQRDDHVTKIFWAGLQIAGLFALPMVVAILIGLQLGGNAKWIALPIAFVFSWILVIRYFNRVSKKMKRIDADIAALRTELDIKTPKQSFDDEQDSL